MRSTQILRISILERMKMDPRWLEKNCFLIFGSLLKETLMFAVSNLFPRGWGTFMTFTNDADVSRVILHHDGRLWRTVIWPTAMRDGFVGQLSDGRFYDGRPWWTPMTDGCMKSCSSTFQTVIRPTSSLIADVIRHCWRYSADIRFRHVTSSCLRHEIRTISDGGCGGCSLSCVYLVSILCWM